MPSGSVPQGDPSPVQLEFAWSPDRQRLVHIAEVRAGEQFLHPDPDLRLPLIARKGLLRRHHFAHHPGAAEAFVAANGGGGGGGEGLRHLNYKLALVHRLQKQGDLPLIWRCAGCDRRERTTLRALVAFDTAAWEVPFGGLRLDVGLLKAGAVQPVAALEVRDSHAIDPAKAEIFTRAAAQSNFRALELPAAPLPLRLPLAVERPFPRLLCSACQTRRADWLTWAADHRPAVNFSGWQELPVEEHGCIRLGGGWATRGADSEALQPVLYWLEIVPLLDREIRISALTVHRRQGRLRWRELRLRAPQGRPTRELEFQLDHAAQDFAAAALRYRQRLARAPAEQLQRWLAQAQAVPMTAPAASPEAKSSGKKSAASRMLPTPSESASPATSSRLTATPPPERRGRLAAWVDRLAHQVADWLDQETDS